MKTNNKSLLKSGYYYETKPWYDDCPDKLPVPEFKTEIFPRAMTHREILDTYKITPYASYAEAAAVVLALIPALTNDYKGRLVYFKEGGTLYRFSAWRYDDGQLDLYVFEPDLDDGWGAEYGVCFGNGTLDASNTGHLDSDVPLELSRAIEVVKSHGYKIIKEY